MLLESQWSVFFLHSKDVEQLLGQTWNFLLAKQGIKKYDSHNSFSFVGVVVE